MNASPFRNMLLDLSLSPGILVVVGLEIIDSCFADCPLLDLSLCQSSLIDPGTRIRSSIYYMIAFCDFDLEVLIQLSILLL